ncbi:hypothetical protein HAX54_047073 [Datura stramonium]|uniref:Uncharacterized protein n=1 Tax=Datura stramonium TaxID=4076 RepID=A0ABS8WLQ3_DATST|nr:hypothetical protein [Datura stramonium]
MQFHDLVARKKEFDADDKLIYSLKNGGRVIMCILGWQIQEICQVHTYLGGDEDEDFEVGIIIFLILTEILDDCHGFCPDRRVGWSSEVGYKSRLGEEPWIKLAIYEL